MSSEQDESQGAPKKPGAPGAGIAIGIGIGAAMGVALDNIAVGIGVGLAIGIAIGIAMQGSSRQKPHDDSEDPE